MVKSLAGIFLGLLIGAACRWLDIPVPSPPKLLGALLVVAMTIGYSATEKLFSHKPTPSNSRTRINWPGETTIAPLKSNDGP